MTVKELREHLALWHDDQIVKLHTDNGPTINNETVTEVDIAFVAQIESGEVTIWPAE